MWSRSKKSTTTSVSSSKPVVNEENIVKMFDSLADEDDPELITTGISTICENLKIDPSSDVRILVLLWKLGAKSKPGSITKSEFVKGMTVLQKDSFAGLKELLPGLDVGFIEKSEFRDFFKFVFQFSREGTHKTIEKDIIISLLPIVLDRNRAPHLDYFIEFLSANSTHQRITLDQWDSFIPFQDAVNVTDLSGFKDEDAWPLLLDEYVEWRKAKK